MVSLILPIVLQTDPTGVGSHDLQVVEALLYHYGRAHLWHTSTQGW